MRFAACLSLVFASLLGCFVESFTFHRSTRHQAQAQAAAKSVLMGPSGGSGAGFVLAAGGEMREFDLNVDAIEGRREWMVNNLKSGGAVLSVLSAGSVLGNPEAAVAASVELETFGMTPEAPIVVVGARGRVGSIIMSRLESEKRYHVGLTRSGEGSSTQYGSYKKGDVRDTQSLSDALAGASAVIFAASASKKGGSAKEVDYQGVLNLGEAVKLNKNTIKRVVLISSGAVTRPDSVGFKLTNVFGNIMNYKIMGELGLKEILKGTGIPYTIIRPGGLTDSKSAGVKGVELSQGDILSSEIGREDVAEVTVASTLSKVTKDTTMEIYGSGKKKVEFHDYFSSVASPLTRRSLAFRSFARRRDDVRHENGPRKAREGATGAGR